MNFRSTYILLAIAGVMLVVLVPKVFFPGKKVAGKGLLLEKFVAAGFKAEDVSALEIEKTGSNPEKLIFQKDAKNQWKLVKPVETRVNGYQVDAIIKNLLSAERVTKGVDVASKEKHNLVNPPVKVTVRKGADISATLSIGSVSVGTNAANVYVLSSDVAGDQPLVTKRNSLSSLFKDGDPKDPLDTASLIKGVEDFRQTKLLGEGTDPLSQTQAVKMSSGKNELVLARDASGTWKFISPSEFGEVESTEPPANPNVPANPEITNIRKLLTAIYDLQVASTKDYDDAPADLKKMGLIENPDQLTIEVTKRNVAGEADSTEVVMIGQSVEGMDKYHARVGGNTFVAKINAAQVQLLKKVLEQPKVLRSHDLVRLNLPKIDAIDVELGGVLYELRAFGPGNWNLFDPNGNRYPANGLAVNQLLESLNRQGQVIDFPPPNYPEINLGLDPKTRAGEVRIWVDGIVTEKEEPKKEEGKKDEGKKNDTKKDEPKKEEPKKEVPKGPIKPKLKGEPNVRLTFGKDTGEGIYVRRIDNGVKLDAIVAKASFSTGVKKSYLDYIEPFLKSFLANDVVKISFNRGTELNEIVREGTEWKIALPESNKGRMADGAKIKGIVEQLSRLRPTRIVSDAPKPEELKSWKVDDSANVMKLTLTDKNGKATIYYFGEGIGAEKLNVYFRSPDEKFIFELPKLYLDNLAQGELIDPLVYRIDRTKVKGLKLQGWADSGEVVTRELEFKDGKWVFKTKLNYQPDLEKLEAFFTDALAPKAEAFFPKSSPKPEQGLDVNKGALQIDFLLEGDKVVTLTLGAPDKDGKGFFAQTNQLPGDIFTLSKDRFKTLRDKPGVFKRD